MFKPLTRTAKTLHRPPAGFAETQFLHQADDEDYSGFAPTQMFDERDELLMPAAPATPADARAAASTSRSALERAAAAPVAALAAADEPHIPQSWVTSQWVAAQEAKAHDAANQARAVIAAQRRADEQGDTPPGAAPAVSRTGLGRLRAAFEKLLPGEFRSLLPLFIGVTVTMALISAMLPVFDKQ
ncbi:MAG: hypothetical protein ABIR54_16255 [Burkholderiaceae bacterium]